MRTLIILIFLSGSCIAQIPVLEQYIEEGIESNLALRQKTFELEQSIAALGEAKGLFLPSVSLNARYSRAGGGRMIEFPVGDLVNPMQQTLNDLLALHGQTGQFPANIANVNIPFLRKQEQDTKIQVLQPVFQPAIYHNFKLKSSLSAIQKAEHAAFIRQLIADIKTAYFNYAVTENVFRLYTETRQLVQENLRVSRSLFENQKATEDIVFRAQAELSDIEQKITESEYNNSLAKNYFNFLLNRDLEQTIEVPNDIDRTDFPHITEENALSSALARREEIHQLNKAVEAASHSVGLAQSNYFPTVNLALDYGIQGEEYSFTKDDDYWMLSIVGQWNIFNGFQDKAKKQQAILEKKRREVQGKELENQIRLQVIRAFQSVESQRKTITASEDRVDSARQNFSIIEAKFREGMVSQVEYLDAQNTLTSAEINDIIVKFGYFIKIAELERAAALYALS